MWLLLVCQTTEHVEARVERRERNADVGTDPSSTRDLKVPQLIVGMRIRHDIRKPAGEPSRGRDAPAKDTEVANPRGRILADFEQRPGGDYAELLRRGQVVSAVELVAAGTTVVVTVLGAGAAAFTLAVSSPEALRFRDDLAFFQAVAGRP